MNILRGLVVVYLFFVLNNCKKNTIPGADGSNIVLNGVETQSQLNNKISIVGQAALGRPVKNARIIVEQLKDKQVINIAETKTDENGEYQIQFGSAKGDFLVSMIGGDGGQFRDLDSNVTLDLSSDDKLSAILLNADIGNSYEINLNIWSTFAVTRARYEYNSGLNSLSEAYLHNLDLFAEHLGYEREFLNIKVPLKTLADGPIAVTPAQFLFLSMMGLNLHAHDVSALVGDKIGLNTLVRLLLIDIEDGIFDGKNNSGQKIVIGNNTLIEDETTRVYLGRSIDAYLNSVLNKSGITEEVFAKQLVKIKTDSSKLYYEAPHLALENKTAQTGAPPMIIITSPQAGQVMNQKDVIAGYIQDADGLLGATIKIDGKEFSVNFDKSEKTKWFFNLKQSLADGEHTLIIEAVDNSSTHNKSSAQVGFKAINSGPDMKIASCTAPDDSKRIMTLSESGIQLAEAPQATCTSDSLIKGEMIFNTLSELIDSKDKTPMINFTITDPFGVQKVTYSASTNAGELVKDMSISKEREGDTYKLSLSSLTLSEKYKNIGLSDQDNKVTVHIVAINKLGNSSTFVVSFTAKVLPVPLYIKDIGTNPSSGLTGFSYSTGNIENVFDNSYKLAYDLVELNQFKVKNLSSKDSYVLDLNLANQGLSIQNKLVHSSSNGYIKNRASCADGFFSLCRYSDRCPCDSNFSYDRMITVNKNTTVKVVVVKLPENKVVAVDNNLLQLLPNESYKIIVGFSRPNLDLTYNDQNIYLNSYTNLSSKACYLYQASEGHVIINEPLKMYNGFIGQHILKDGASGSKNYFYGVADCNAFSCGSLDYYGSDYIDCAPFPGPDYENKLPWDEEFSQLKATISHSSGIGRIIGDVFVQRSLSFTNQTVWSPQVNLLGSTRKIINLTYNQTPVSITQTYNIEATRPSLTVGTFFMSDLSAIWDK